LLPGYTHRQRAQPVSAAYYLCAWGAMFGRDAQALRQVLGAVSELPLGVGALGGTSLPIDREVTRAILRFDRVTANGLDTVGDRDFALDFAYAAARSLLHASRVATDVIDFATAEFGYLRLDDEIAMGSSMMPQKRNPDLFELIRGKTGRAVGNLNALLVTVKGLPGGYNRDLQEDRQPLLETGPLLVSVLRMLRLGLSRVRFDGARGRAALQDGATAATDIAEALAERGVPFRTAYKLTGALVRKCSEAGIALSQAPLDLAREIDARFSAEVLSAADAAASVSRKRNAGGTGPSSIQQQIEALSRSAGECEAAARAVPRLGQLVQELGEAHL
jgi:argininosuccinate lyase